MEYDEVMGSHGGASFAADRRGTRQVIGWVSTTSLKARNLVDITGTGSKEPTANDCTDANRALHAARVTRQKYPDVSAEDYQKAAAATRRAGDTQFELMILREAAAPRPPDQPTDSDRCAELIREVGPDITAAEAMEKNDPTCITLTEAAERYFKASKVFFHAIELGQTQDQLLRSCLYIKTHELLLRRDRLLYRVDDMKQQGLCNGKPKGQLVKKTGGPPPDQDDDAAWRKKCETALASLSSHAPSPQWLEDEMNRAHCRQNGEPMSPSKIAEYEARKKKDDSK